MSNSNKKIRVKKNDNLTVNKINMSCDNSRPKKLDDALQWHFATLVSGGPGSGKSNLWMNLITKKGKFYWKMFDKIHIFSPSLHTISKAIHLPEEQLISDFNMELLQYIIDNADPEHETLIIIDDFAAELKKNIRPMLRVVWNRRHLKTSIIIVTQKYNAVPLELRTAMSSIISFNKNKRELDDIYNEHVHIERPLFESIVDMAFAKRHNFIYLKLDEFENDKYYINFDKVVIEDD